jgi:hypothetical protein
MPEYCELTIQLAAIVCSNIVNFRNETVLVIRTDIVYSIMSNSCTSAHTHFAFQTYKCNRRDLEIRFLFVHSSHVCSILLFR